MPAYVRSRITGEVVSPCYLDAGDAERAAVGFEQLYVDDWMAGKAVFPRRSGMQRIADHDGTWPLIVSTRLARLTAEFLAACR